MDYQIAGQHQYHLQHQQHKSSLLVLPDASSSSDKMLMWSTTSEYANESGYSTQAPSISPYDLSNTNYESSSPTSQDENNLNGLTSPKTMIKSMVNFEQKNDSDEIINDNNNIEANDADDDDDDDDDNNVVNWINSQDSLEMALKAVPDLLKLLGDEDQVVVKESSIILNQMSRMEIPRQALMLTTDVVSCIVECLFRTSDLETVKNLVGALYGISTQKPNGVQAICQSRALPLLIMVLAAPIESIVHYAITTIHNILLECGDAVKASMRKSGAVHHLVPLLNHQNQNVKFLAIVVDCLCILAHHNQEAKMILLQTGGTQQLIALLFNHNQQYPKLIQNIIRLLKWLSTCNNNKQAMLAMNAIQPLSSHLMALSAASAGNSSMSGCSTSTSSSSSNSRDIITNTLIILRNLSDAATQLVGLAPFITSLLNFTANSSDTTHIEMAAEILANLTVNDANKTAAINSNAIPIFLKLIAHYSGITSNSYLPKIVDPCMCAVRHLTTVRYPEALRAQELVRSCNGLGVLVSVMRITPRHWGVTKAVLGVVRNFTANQFNSEYMRQYDMISNLMTILFETFNLIQLKTNNGQTQTRAEDVSQDGIKLSDIVKTSTESLVQLAKETVNKIIMRNLECIGFFMQMFYSPLGRFIQRSAASLLAELSSSPECAMVIEQMPGFHDFIRANFCNQFGHLLTNTAGDADTLKFVSVMMERLQEHRNTNNNASNGNNNNMMFNY